MNSYVLNRLKRAFMKKQHIKVNPNFTMLPMDIHFHQHFMERHFNQAIALLVLFPTSSNIFPSEASLQNKEK